MVILTHPVRLGVGYYTMSCYLLSEIEGIAVFDVISSTEHLPVGMAGLGNDRRYSSGSTFTMYKASFVVKNCNNYGAK